MIVTADNVAFSYDGNSIFKGVSFCINEGERIGLVGENGAGKTTLIKLILGEIPPDEGSIYLKNNLKIGYLAQTCEYDSEDTVYGEMRSVFAEQLAALEKLSSLSESLARTGYGSAEYSALSAKIESLNKYVASHDCYNIDVRIKTVLNGMGFSAFYERKVNSMSGGEKTRLRLARLLLEDNDLLILDEPTNHLDIDTLFWLEGYLSAFKGAIFAVSHDRYFLDRIAQATAEIENGAFRLYRGNYSKYKILKQQAYERELKEYEALIEERERLQTYVDKNIVRATTAKSAQSRVKKLEKLPEPVKPFTPPLPPRFDFTFERQPAEEVVAIDGLNLSAGGKQLISGGSLNIRRGEKIAIVGENGAGKSTLLRAIVCGKEEKISIGRYVAFSYYDQENANLNPENTVLEELWGRHAAYSQTQARSLLASGGLTAEDVDKKVRSLSGGERAKLALCVFASEGGNVLALDEPTNHLDLPARESLESALRSFCGTVIFVSHDRYFISAIADGVVEIAGGKLTRYDGGYAGYKAAKEREAEERNRREAEERTALYKEKRENSYRSRKDRAEEAKRRSEIKSVEEDISACEEEEQRLNSYLTSEEVASDYGKLRQTLEKLQKIREKLDALYERYGEIID